jgi:hypothetical protein
MDNNEIKEYLTNKFTNLGKQTIKLYSIKLNQLHKHFNAKFDKDFDLLQNFQTIINYIKSLDVSVDNKLAFLNAIVLVVRNVENDDLFHTLQQYIKFRNELSIQKFDKYKDNNKSENFVDYEILLDISKPPNFKTDSVEKILDDMNAYISVRYPLRLSLYNAEIVKAKKNIEDDKNYLYITPRKLYFIMNNFKNVKIIGKQQIEITDKEHEKVIRDYVKFLNKEDLNQRLLWSYYKKPLIFPSSDMYAYNLKKLFKNRLTGFFEKKSLVVTDKNISMNDIRKAYETKLINSDYYKSLTNRQKEAEHKKLLHSPNIAMMVYNKV